MVNRPFLVFFIGMEIASVVLLYLVYIIGVWEIVLQMNPPIFVCSKTLLKDGYGIVSDTFWGVHWYCFCPYIKGGYGIPESEREKVKRKECQV